MHCLLMMFLVKIMFKTLLLVSVFKNIYFVAQIKDYYRAANKSCFCSDLLLPEQREGHTAKGPGIDSCINTHIVAEKSPSYWILGRPQGPLFQWCNFSWTRCDRKITWEMHNNEKEKLGSLPAPVKHWNIWSHGPQLMLSSSPETFS